VFKAHTIHFSYFEDRQVQKSKEITIHDFDKGLDGIPVNTSKIDSLPAFSP